MVLRAGNAVNEGLNDDLMKCIKQTQKNMFEINRSRLQAIEDATQERKNSELKGW